MVLAQIALRARHLTRWLAFGMLLVAAPPLAAQVPQPFPPAVVDPGRQPELPDQIRRQVQGSGLTEEQIRSRLRAAGYPESMLDAYLPGADTTRDAQPAPGTIDALRALGILSVEQTDSLQTLDSLRLVSDSIRQLRELLQLRRADSLRIDSLADSLAARGRLKIFGIEVFRRTSTRFQPAQMGPVDESYRLGPGDVMVLVVTGDVEVTRQLEVTRDGFVVVPQVGQIYVANLTLGQVRDVLHNRLRRVYSGIGRGAEASTRFDVTVAKLRNIQVYVVGDVVRPGAYQISGAGTALTALYAAGGPTANGSFRRVEIRRAGKLVDTLDVYDYLLRGDLGSDTRLQSGDVVFVPVHGAFVQTTGEVRRRAVFEVKPHETLRDVLEFSGGFTEQAYQRRVQIYRTLTGAGEEGPSRVVVDVGPREFAEGVVPAVPLVAGDSVIAFALTQPVRRFVTVRGSVWVEGPVGFRSGMRLSDAIRLAGGPKPGVYLERILVTRTRPDSSRVQLRSAFADSAGAVTDDLALAEGDVVEIFSRAAHLPEVYVTVTGAVRTQGRIPYREGMTLRDAVLVAGGLDEGADLREAEIARIANRARSGALAETIRVPLDSTYLFNRFLQAGYAGAPGYPAPASGAPETPLRPYDNVLILRQPGWDLQRLVWLTGQVKRPGRYALTSKTERLSDLIARAGGLTEHAYAGGVEFYRVTPFQRQRDLRRETDERERARLAETRLTARPVDDTDERRSIRAPDGLLSTTPGAAAPDTTEVPIRERLPNGYRDRVGVDLVRALRDEGSHHDLILAGGDSLHVPEFEAVIMVTGAVNAPGPVAYEPGKNLDWYVRAAGGYSARGDNKRAYVTQPNGKKETVIRRTVLADAVPLPRPGGEIYVPQKIIEEQNNAVQVLGVVASAIASLITAIAVIAR